MPCHERRGGMREKEGRAMSGKMTIPRVKIPAEGKSIIFFLREKWERVG